MWLGPPAIQSRMTLLRPAERPPRLRRPGALAQQGRQAQPGQARQARLEHVAAADDGQALPLQGVEAAEGVLVAVRLSVGGSHVVLEVGRIEVASRTDRDSHDTGRRGPASPPDRHDPPLIELHRFEHVFTRPCSIRVGGWRMAKADDPTYGKSVTGSIGIIIRRAGMWPSKGGLPEGDFVLQNLPLPPGEGAPRAGEGRRFGGSRIRPARRSSRRSASWFTVKPAGAPSGGSPCNRAVRHGRLPWAPRRAHTHRPARDLQRARNVRQRPRAPAAKDVATSGSSSFEAVKRLVQVPSRAVGGSAPGRAPRPRRRLAPPVRISAIPSARKAWATDQA